jgi:hypothetical protein
MDYYTEKTERSAKLFYSLIFFENEGNKFERIIVLFWRNIECHASLKKSIRFKGAQLVADLRRILLNC